MRPLKGALSAAEAAAVEMLRERRAEVLTAEPWPVTALYAQQMAEIERLRPQVLAGWDAAIDYAARGRWDEACATLDVVAQIQPHGAVERAAVRRLREVDAAEERAWEEERADRDRRRVAAEADPSIVQAAEAQVDAAAERTREVERALAERAAWWRRTDPEEIGDSWVEMEDTRPLREAAAEAHAAVRAAQDRLTYVRAY